MRDQIDHLVSAKQQSALCSLLNDAELSIIRYAARQLSSAIQASNGDLIESLTSLVSDPSPGAQHLACQLVPYAYQFRRKQAVNSLPALIESDDWTIRDAACEVTGRLLRDDFTRMLAVLESWRTQPSVNVARAIAIASIRASDPMHIERADPLLNLIEPLLSERDSIVRRNLGPSAIGNCLLAHYPTQTFEYLAKWSTSYDPQTLWNVAMAFSALPAVAITKKALIILRKLSLDERRFVWRAVASAMWKLGRKRPDLIRPELTRWLEDERRVNAAREAIKYL